MSLHGTTIDPRLDAELEARGLPEVAFIDNSHDQSIGAPPVIAVKRGEDGYYPIYSKQSADELNRASGVTKEQAAAMYVGSAFGWNVPGATPKKT